MIGLLRWGSLVLNATVLSLVPWLLGTLGLELGSPLSGSSPVLVPVPGSGPAALPSHRFA